MRIATSIVLLAAAWLAVGAMCTPAQADPKGPKGPKFKKEKHHDHHDVRKHVEKWLKDQSKHHRQGYHVWIEQRENYWKPFDEWRPARRGWSVERRRLVQEPDFSLATVAYRLEQAVDRFYDRVRDRRGFSHLSHDVRRLAESASEFFDLVDRADDGGISPGELDDAFSRLEWEYNHVERMLYRVHDRQPDESIRRDWFAVVRQFDQVYWYIAGQND